MDDIHIDSMVTITGAEYEAMCADNKRLREGVAVAGRLFAACRDALAEVNADNERLRAALKECLGWHDYADDMYKPIEVRAAYMRARAALTAQPAAPGGE